MGSALASSRSVLELAGVGSVEHRGSFWQLLTETTSIAPPATNTLPRKPSTEAEVSGNLTADQQKEQYFLLDQKLVQMGSLSTITRCTSAIHTLPKN